MKIGTLCYVRDICVPAQFAGRVCEVRSEPVSGRDKHGNAVTAYRCLFREGLKLTAAALLIPITPPGPKVIRRRRVEA